jgi:transposase
MRIKSAACREMRAVLTVRTVLMQKAQDVENAIRGLLVGMGMAAGRLDKRPFEQCVRRIVEKDPIARRLVEPLLTVRATLRREQFEIEAHLRATAREDAVCRRLMTAPGIGELIAMTFRVAVDDPARFARSRTVGAHFGLTPTTHQSGEGTRSGRISRRGDGAVRTALVLAAKVLFRKNVRQSWLTTWAAQVAARRGGAKAMIAVARKLAVVLHRMWVSETDFRWNVESSAR